MGEGKSTLYGDGKLSVTTTPQEVIFSEVVSEDGLQVLHVVAMSHAAFREIHLAWTRHEEEERGQ